jgi:hypothetical protein
VHIGQPFLWPVSAKLEQRQTNSTTKKKKKKLKNEKKKLCFQYFDLATPLFATCHFLHHIHNPFRLLCDICALTAQI